MKPNIQNTTLKITAGCEKDFPKDQRPQIALSGRSNVGKSSLLNTLIRRKNYARVSQMPGKTITINFYDVSGDFYIVDLPGYGFAKRAPADKTKWSSLTNGYFVNDKPSLTAVCQLIDLKVGVTDDDIMMLDFMNQSGIEYFIVATKSDKLNVTTKAIQLEKLKNSEFVKQGTEIIPFSALSGAGRDEVLKKMLSYLR